MTNEETSLKGLLDEFGSGNDQDRGGEVTPPAAGQDYEVREISGFDRELHARKRSGVRLQQEQLHHRMFCLLKAQGFSAVEIAERTGYTAVCVQYTLAQPWAEEMVLEEMTKLGRRGVEAVLNNQVIPSIQKLIDVRDSEDASKDVQRKAANDLLDRVFGKPNQPMVIKSEMKDVTQMTDAEIAAEVAKRKSQVTN